ncbi:hypothetical protein KUTeg_024573 [Tegillarca granosa]|uniref:Uncharacterized protein n=1 Tax=Tegillarca granosa TaxID=220873 RepID=A0ABQ9DYF8_TEGGR|nr:hypothetical protein KUTeg_024573 [Tegillarca granosa]
MIWGTAILVLYEFLKNSELTSVSNNIHTCIFLFFYFLFFFCFYNNWLICTSSKMLGFKHLYFHQKMVGNGIWGDRGKKGVGKTWGLCLYSCLIKCHCIVKCFFHCIHHIII